MTPAAPRTGPCSPVEIADAAVLGCVCLVICLLGWFIPHASGVTVLATAPMAIVAHRHRARAVLAASISASVVGFLVAGTGPLASVLGCGLVGGVAGAARRRHWHGGTVLLASLALIPPIAGFADLWLYVFSATRHLILEQLTNSWKGLASFLRSVSALTPVVDAGNHAVHAMVVWWWVTVAAGLGWTLVISTLSAWYLIPPLIARLEAVQPLPSLTTYEAPGPADPVPVRFDDVHLRYPDAANEALRGVSGEIRPGTLTALVGPNGSGKSTLARVIAGGAVTTGTVERPGRAALGEPDGTAVIEQRPETQVLGIRVADDVVWGMKDPSGTDIGALLETVGLAGMGERDTATLSGGELQRLAIAAALARRPSLLVSDESTAMVDAAGRVQISEVLAGLGARGVTVVHVTHHAEETSAADQVLAMDDGLIVASTGPLEEVVPHPSLRRPAPLRPSPGKAHTLELEGVGHIWSERTPWAQRALSGVTARIEPGEGVVVVGGNGSGKSTLAWILAGLVVPTEGTCTLGGVATSAQVGAVGLAFQHARLQLQRPTVLGDIRAAGGVDKKRAAEVLAEVGLDPDELGDRSIETLSGGQLRRVALAGILARDPKVLILDEPLAGLDTQSRVDVLAVLRRLRVERATTLVMVSHDLEGVASVCDRSVNLVAGHVTSDVPLDVYA